MDPEIKALDAKVVLALPVGSPLVLSWYEDGTRLASAQIVATESNALVLNVWRSGALGLGNQPEIWNLKADGRFLVDSRKHFRCSLRLPSEREMELFKTHLKKFPVPAIPLEGALVKIQYDVDPLECDLPEAVGTVVIQHFDEMRVDVCYYSTKQQKIINEPIRLDRAESGWMDRDAGTECVLTILDRLQFDSWLADDEKSQKRKAAPATAAAAPVSKPAGKVVATKKRKAAKK
jgi:hypothetical protein